MMLSCCAVSYRWFMATTHASTIGFRPNEEDLRILAKAGDSPTAALRRGLRLLDHELWLEQWRKDALERQGENLNDEPDAW